MTRRDFVDKMSKEMLKELNADYKNPGNAEDVEWLAELQENIKAVSNTTTLKPIFKAMEMGGYESREMYRFILRLLLDERSFDELDDAIEEL